MSLHNTNNDVASGVGSTYTAPNNPGQGAVRHTDAAPYEGTGTSQYNNNVGSTTGTSTTGSKVGGAAHGVKGVLAAVHGAGEKIRGEFNGAVDEAFHEPSGVAKNASVAHNGDAEIATGEFSSRTKNREGALPGSDYEKQHHHGQAVDLNRE